MKQQPEQSKTMASMIQPQSTNGDESLSSVGNGSNSILEFLNQEQKCLNSGENDSELDIESIFEEINRLSDESDERSVDEILREAELLLCKQQQIETDLKISAEIQKNEMQDKSDATIDLSDDKNSYELCQLNRHLDTISEKTTPHNTNSNSSDIRDELTLQRMDDLEMDQQKERCQAIRRIPSAKKQNPKIKTKPLECLSVTTSSTIEQKTDEIIDHLEIPAIESNETDNHQIVLPNDNNHHIGLTANVLNSPKHEQLQTIKQNIPVDVDDDDNDDFGNHMLPILSKPRTSRSSSIATLASPTTPIATMLSASSSFSWTRERALEQQIDSLRETLKDTEERLHSLRLQYDNVSQQHRTLRDVNHQMQEEMDRLKIDAQHLRDCANILRNELQSARKDRAEALELQATLQRELDASRNEKKRVGDEAESNARQILDLQRQCKEMERILARKNPDAMQMLLGIGSKKMNDEQTKIAAARKQLEQRIAQLENDAREQDRKAQLILANVQSRFSSVQSKYETHISDLETQVLSLQQINQILNEKIEAQSRLKSPNNNYMVDQQHSATQTESFHDNVQTDTVSTQTPTDDKSPPTKPNSVIKKPTKQVVSTKEETHLLATVRGMRVDLAIKEKALQRLTRELDDCKKTIRKLQKENENGTRNEKLSKKPYDPAQFAEATNGSAHDTQLQEKIKLLEMDYKALHDKRLQDLKTLQSAHEREISANKETVRLLEQRLAERDEAFAIIQKHNKIPIDYFALKAKVSSLERRHTEREQRLHILVEALSKGRLSGPTE